MTQKSYHTEPHHITVPRSDTLERSHTKAVRLNKNVLTREESLENIFKPGVAVMH